MHLKLITVLEDQHVTRYQISVLKIQSEDLEKYCNENFIHDHLRVRKNKSSVKLEVDDH